MRLIILSKMKSERLWYHLKGKESLDSYMGLILPLRVTVELVMVSCYCYLKVDLHASNKFGAFSTGS